MASNLSSFSYGNSNNNNPFMNPIGKVQAQLQVGSTAQTTIKPYGQGDYQALTNSLKSLNGLGSSGRGSGGGNGGIVASTNKPFNFNISNFNSNNDSGLNGNSIGRSSQVVPTGNRMSFRGSSYGSDGSSGGITQRDIWQAGLTQSMVSNAQNQQNRVNSDIRSQQNAQMDFEKEKFARESFLQSSQFNTQVNEGARQFDVSAAQKKIESERQAALDKERIANEKLANFQQYRASKQAALGGLLSSMRPIPF